MHLNQSPYILAIISVSKSHIIANHFTAVNPFCLTGKNILMCFFGYRLWDGYEISIDFVANL